MRGLCRPLSWRHVPWPRPAPSLSTMVSVRTWRSSSEEPRSHQEPELQETHPFALGERDDRPGVLGHLSYPMLSGEGVPADAS